MNSETWQVKATLLLVSSLTIMSMITISASLPDMTATFSEVPNHIALVKLSLSFPGLFIALSAIAAGIIIDKTGRLKLLGVALVLYAIGGTSGYWLNNLYAILAGRALLGISVGISMTIVTTLVADYYQGKARQKFAGLQIAVMSLGGILFITLGGILADINWRVPFLLYLFSILILPSAFLFLKEPGREKQLQQKIKIKSPGIIWLIFFNVMLMWIIFFIIPVQIPFYLKSIGIEKNTMIGIAIASSTLFSAISSFSYSRIKDLLGFRQIFGLGYFLMALAFIAIAYGNSYVMVLLGMLLAGFGMGLMIPNANVWVMQLAPQEIRGQEIGRLTTFWFLGQFLSPLVLLPFLDYFSLAQLFYGLGIVLFGLTLTFLVWYWVQPRQIQ
ncbi:MAG: MFS transporter [Flavobacteriaceae bacterium]|nr:MFS transporter [Muriicola sp.]MBT8289217.1 MFS transporter [Muriicola sp.]NNK34410.1 MFS transporter [Eudoraea sp.]NNL39883.1 MFS transporter [Flavobacteriaceae bacterium]